MLRASYIASLLKAEDTDSAEGPLVITPLPNLDDLEIDHSASVDLRLGTWFRTTRARSHTVLDIYDEQNLDNPSEQSLSTAHYVPFGRKFILHPGSFVLAVTLEWIRIPLDLAGQVTGKSSWARRGLIIETAPGVHPGFTGCLTLELSNVGEIPIALVPGTKICQLFLHQLDESSEIADGSRYLGQRQPLIGRITLDDFARKLSINSADRKDN